MFNNLGLALGMTLKLYTSLAKGLKLRVKLGGLTLTFVDVTMVAGPLCHLPSSRRLNIGFRP